MDGALSRSSLAAQPWNYDYVHLHFDAYASMWAKLAEDYRFELIVTSHHSYVAASEHWNADYRHIIRSLSKIKYHLVLSPKIKEIYKNAGFTGKVAVLPITIASQACRDNQQFRSQIRSYAKQQFDWNIIAERYIKLLKKRKEGLGCHLSVKVLLASIKLFENHSDHLN
ncbi:hypothetical protein [Paenibacillus abyssi]|uniref:Uncharacterized protein n=2 Tax=Paenibacillus abyssi TaxID=1340531 RepID=A0A917FS20_9BACL|nr:hypothetical protein [Paenibacillus abyssi]GGG00769.1 hypothetical protein GCM10010916_17380 [Paenibacillus abyssi]